MTERPDKDAVREMMAALEIGHNQMREREADGWGVVVIDDEFEAHVHIIGPFATQLEALIASEKQKAEDARMNEGEEHLWTHHILPMFNNDDKREEKAK